MIHTSTILRLASFSSCMFVPVRRFCILINSLGTKKGKKCHLTPDGRGYEWILRSSSFFFFRKQAPINRWWKLRVDFSHFSLSEMRRFCTKAYFVPLLWVVLVQFSSFFQLRFRPKPTSAHLFHHKNSFHPMRNELFPACIIGRLILIHEIESRKPKL